MFNKKTYESQIFQRETLLFYSEPRTFLSQ